MKIRDYIKQWSTLFYSRNPYGKSIPSTYLFSEKLIREYDKDGRKVYYANLSELKQDGWSMDYIVPAETEAPWEIWEIVSFSPIFHRLMQEEKMCPSNYIVNIIDALDVYEDEDAERNEIIHTEDFYIGTIARGLRALASYIREYSLAEIIENYLLKYALQYGVQFEMYRASVTQDMKYKTDILFRYDNQLYRAWSYQTTKNGIPKTSRRVLNANGHGYNILFPFNMWEKNNVAGWFLYDEKITENTIAKLITNNAEIPMEHWEYCEKVMQDNNIIKIPAIFVVE